MTSTPPLAAVADVCRITVDGPAGRTDLAVPVTLPIAELLPVLLRHAGLPADGDGTWVLQRLGDEPLDPDGTPQTLGLHHGEVLWMRTAEQPLPPLHFDDAADGVAHVISGQPGRWTPAATRALALAGAALSVPALAACALTAGPGTSAAVCAGTLALLLAGACAAAARPGAHRSAALIGSGTAMVGGCGALALAALAGLVARSGPHGGFAPGTPGLLLAAGAVTLVACLLLGARALPYAVPSTALLIAASVAGGCGLVAATGCPATQAVTVVAAVLFVFGHLGPRTALRLARLRVPHLPHDAEELQQDIDPQPEERIRSRVALASALLDALALTSAVVYLAAWWLLLREGGWIGWALPLLFAGAVLLRARDLTGVTQRLATAVSGATGLALVLLVAAAPRGAGWRIAVLVVLLAAACLLALAAERLPTGRLLPIWGHLGDIGEWVTTIAILPLLLQAVHVYAYFRSLAG